MEVFHVIFRNRAREPMGRTSQSQYTGPRGSSRVARSKWLHDEPQSERSPHEIRLRSASSHSDRSQRGAPRAVHAHCSNQGARLAKVQGGCRYRMVRICAEYHKRFVAICVESEALMCEPKSPQNPVCRLLL